MKLAKDRKYIGRQLDYPRHNFNPRLAFEDLGGYFSLCKDIYCAFNRSDWLKIVDFAHALSTVNLKREQNVLSIFNTFFNRRHSHITTVRKY